MPGFCLACNRPVPAWQPGPGNRANARCPLCQALERHRLLALLLRALTQTTGQRDGMVLDVAPHAQVRRVLESIVGERYVGVDRFEDRAVDVWGDLTCLPFRQGAFGLVVCYHVLEHIPDDAAAIAELVRVLAPGGVALVQVPHRQGRPTDEDPAVPAHERARRFGQADHVRWYGDDFEQRLATGGLAVMALRPRELLTGMQLQRFSVMPDETVWLCSRTEHHAVLPELRDVVAAAAARSRRRVGLRALLPVGWRTSRTAR